MSFEMLVDKAQYQRNDGVSAAQFFVWAVSHDRKITRRW